VKGGGCGDVVVVCFGGGDVVHEFGGDVVVVWVEVFVWWW